MTWTRYRCGITDIAMRGTVNMAVFKPHVNSEYRNMSECHNHTAGSRSGRPQVPTLPDDSREATLPRPALSCAAP